MKMIYTFWEGKKPSYISLCMKTWSFPYIELNYGNLQKYTDFDIERAKRFTLPQIADCVRVHVLRDNGGHWLDADTIMFTDKLPDCTILGNPVTRMNTIGMLQAQEEMFEAWAKYQDEVIRTAEPPQDWSIMGNAFTDGYLKEHREVSIGDIGSRWAEVEMVSGNASRMEKYKELYFANSYHLSDFRKTDMLMLHNSWTPEWYKQMTEAQVLNADCTLSNILNES